MNTTTISLKEQWAALKEDNPKLRIRNAAQELDATEVELLATQLGENAIRLKPEFQAILKEVETLGKVMALTRNDDVVHERKGVYLNPSLNNAHVGLFVGADIDLRIFFATWSSVFAVQDGEGEKARYSIQFFAGDGEAIHKIYLIPESNKENYNKLVDKYRFDVQSTPEVSPFDASEKRGNPTKEDVEKFQDGWRNLKDTHDFFGLVKKYKLSRIQALENAPEGNYAIPVSNQTLREILNNSSEKQIPIMVFVGNKGMIQIHTGEVNKIVDHNEWLNVLDPDFNLHVRENAIKSSWIVRKPSVDGTVTALECFDENEKQIVQLFGKRKPGIPELESWRELVAEVEEAQKL